jgi:hypothetical protein
LRKLLDKYYNIHPEEIKGKIMWMNYFGNDGIFIRIYKDHTRTTIALHWTVEEAARDPEILRLLKREIIGRSWGNYTEKILLDTFCLRTYDPVTSIIEEEEEDVKTDEEEDIYPVIDTSDFFEFKNIISSVEIDNNVLMIETDKYKYKLTPVSVQYDKDGFKEYISSIENGIVNWTIPIGTVLLRWGYKFEKMDRFI